MRVLATATAGTNRILAEECGDLGLKPRRVPAHGVEMDLDWAQIARGLMHLRTAQRLLIRLAHIPCDGAQSLYDGVRAIDWTRYLDAKQTLAIGASGRLPKKRRGGPLTNHVFASQRIKDAIVDQFRDKQGERPNVDVSNPDVRVVARFVGDAASIWLDPCGTGLHIRGYRKESVEAPLRETMAAALVRSSSWDPDRPFIDPMCGSGTIAIEAACIGLGLAAGRLRTFGAENWRHEGGELPALIAAEREAAHEHAHEAIARSELRIACSDSDKRAVGISRANAKRAGVQQIVKAELADARDLAHPERGTVIICNPPWGERMGSKSIVNLYASIGRQWRGFSGCELVIIDGHDDFESAFGLPCDGVLEWSNGPISVRIRRYLLGHQTKRSASRKPRRG